MNRYATYYKNNKAKCALKHAIYYRKNKAKLKAYAKAHRQANAERFRRVARAWRKKNRARVIANKRKLRYGITAEQTAAMLRRQKGRCAICRIDVAVKFHIDHCHLTKKVRGILCGPCNQGLGMFYDDAVALANAIKYLRRSK